MKDSLVLRFLYGTVVGRLFLKVLVQPGISRVVGKFLSSGASRWLILYYTKKHKIDLSDIEIPRDGFDSFNDFFTRKHKRDRFEFAEGHLISPCEGFLTVMDIEKDSEFTIKHTRYSVEDLLKDKSLAARFEGGKALVFRLTPANYHRYCYPANGRVLSEKRIPGVLHCVRPIALRSVPVFAQNSREYQVIRTERFGTMVQMEIGALLVGKITNRKRPCGKWYVQAGDEKGYFEFGGSTIVLFLPKGAVTVESCETERPIHMGDCI